MGPEERRGRVRERDAPSRKTGPVQCSDFITRSKGQPPRINTKERIRGTAYGVKKRAPAARGERERAAAKRQPTPFFADTYVMKSCGAFQSDHPDTAFARTFRSPTELDSASLAALLVFETLALLDCLTTPNGERGMHRAQAHKRKAARPFTSPGRPPTACRSAWSMPSARPATWPFACQQAE